MVMMSTVEFVGAILGSRTSNNNNNQRSSWLAAISPEDGSYRGLRFDYPQELDVALDTFLLKYRGTHNMYVCVNTTDSPEKRVARDVTTSNVVYADLDSHILPNELLVPPTYVLRTSESKNEYGYTQVKHQAFWVMETPVPADETSQVSRQIAIFHGLDPCWDKVRLMRLPGTLNFKYVDYEKFKNQIRADKMLDLDQTPELTQTTNQTQISTSASTTNQTQISTSMQTQIPYEVKIVYSSQAKYRISDFRRYPSLPTQSSLRFISVNNENKLAQDMPEYEELPSDEQDRIDEYTNSAIESELLKLSSLEMLYQGEVYKYVTRDGIIEGYGWDSGCMWVASCLIELANSPWNGYTLDQAYSDFMTNAPTDNKFTKNKLYEKWKNAYNKCHVQQIKVRGYPLDVNDFVIVQAPVNTKGD